MISLSSLPPGMSWEGQIIKYSNNFLGQRVRSNLGDVHLGPSPLAVQFEINNVLPI